MTICPNLHRALVERDADPFLPAPGNVARPFQLGRWHIKREAVGDEQRGHHFQRGAGLRDISNGAIDYATAELYGSSLQHAAPGRDSGLVHAVVIDDSRRYVSTSPFNSIHCTKEKLKITAGRFPPWSSSAGLPYLRSPCLPCR